MSKEKNPENVKRGKQNRNKGYRGESIFRKTMDNYFPVKRNAHPGIKGDLTLFPDIINDKMEIKFRESLPEWLWNYLDGVSFLGLKKKHKEPLVVMRLNRFIELYKKFHEGD